MCYTILSETQVLKQVNGALFEGVKMSDTISVEGKEFSVETVKEALRKHCNFESDVEPKQVKVHCFRAAKAKHGHDYPYYLGGVLFASTKWNGETVQNNEAQITCYEREEVKQIIAGLQNLLKA